MRLSLLSSVKTTQQCRQFCQNYRQRVCKKCSLQSRQVVRHSFGENQWMELAKSKKGEEDDDDIIVEQDADYINSINQLCNKILKALLSSDIQRVMDVKDELSGLGEACAENNYAQGALFMYVMYRVCENTIPKEVDMLDGAYHEAFIKIFAMLEDSGWGLKREETKNRKADA
eukprot:TRINITY_DN15658_c0_g2_i1.p2 TRINITY_DN15658_c0_g2~~TRINITY_DN15658_c0_g2_i1.p2  ORF type:complete len:173 (+),score=30.51 TRINITY_DN15658_c0_g2_i1:46-564(+)